LQVLLKYDIFPEFIAYIHPVNEVVLRYCLITGAVVSSTIDVVGATAHAVAGSDDEEESDD